MDLHAASELLLRRFASLSMASRTARANFGGGRFAAAQSNAPRRRDLGLPSCRTCRLFSSNPTRRKDDSTSQPSSQASYKADIYQQRSTFADELHPKARLAPKDGPRSPAQAPAAPGPQASLSTSSPEAAGAQRLVEGQPVAQASTQLGERQFTWGTSRLKMPSSNDASRDSVEDITFPQNPSGVSKIKASPKPRIIQELDIHVKPRTGRTLAVNSSMPTDLGRKLRMLDMLVMRNRIRYEAKRQQFYERPGLRRKRLASERWRKKFKTMFRTTANRVRDLKHQGW